MLKNSRNNIIKY